MQKYEIMSAIGEGAYGVVLKCRDVENKNYVAIKKFKDTDEEELTRKTTMREVKVLKMLSHENIVQMKQAFRKKGIVFLVFQYVENNLLEVLEKSPNGLHPNIIRKLMFQLVKGLSYLHNLDIVHRDIKLENLLVSSQHDLKICDFGFARQTKKQKDKGQIQLTDYVATRWYRPPELLVGGEYGKEIDMWAVGCIMCELIDGNPLFPGQNQLDQLFLIQKTLGPLSQELHQRFIKNQRFLGMKFPQIQNLDPIHKKYFGKIDQKGLSLIKSLLKMNAAQRLTAQQALNHPYFESQRSQASSSKSQTYTDDTSRKQIYTSTTNRKKQYDVNNQIERSTKYGKIYNKRKTNYNAIAMIYQSSNNCKMYTNHPQNPGHRAPNAHPLQSKSLGKTHHKKMTTYQDNNLSLQKHHNKDILLKTQAKGFYIEGSEDRLAGYGGESPEKKDFSRKNQGNWLSTNNLPFLMMTGNQPLDSRNSNYNGTQGKKKPHIVLNKNNSYRSNVPSNFVRR